MSTLRLLPFPLPFALLLLCFTGGSPPDVFSDCRQLVIVLAPHPDSVTARLWRFEKVGKAWRAVDQPHPVNLGKKGLAWGRGLHSAKSGRQKQESDQRSPAGLFRFGTAFGYAPAGTLELKLEYQPITATQICVEDSDSRHYNQIVDEQAVRKDWKARESMLRRDEQYKWGIYVRHNFPPVAQGGSCIFFHLWRAPDAGTLGCTAMAEDDLLALLQWLDPQQKPVLMQMLVADYQKYQPSFRLPKL